MEIKALGYLEIESTDLSQWFSFMNNVVGLMPAPAMSNTDEAIYFKMDAYSWRFKVRKGEVNRLATAGWELEDKSAFDAALLELKEANIDFDFLSEEQCTHRLVREAVSLNDPDGNRIELFYFMKLDYARLNSSVGIQEFETGYHGNMGLGHFVIPSANFSNSHSFYTRVLGFEETDYMHFHFNPDPAHPGQGLHFLHVNNPRHHSLALFQDDNPPPSNCVHLMVEVKNIDEVGHFIDRCKTNNVPIVSSLGRHSNDQMISVYAATPGGFALEFGCDGVQLDWNNYQPTESSLPSLWGHEWAPPPE